MRPSASCELWLDGTRVPDAGVDLYAGRPTALSGLTLTWGRDGPHEQPGPATMVVDVLDTAADAAWLDALHVGSDVQLWAEGDIPGQAVPWLPSIFDDGSFTGKADGPVPAADALIAKYPSVFGSGPVVDAAYTAHTMLLTPRPYKQSQAMAYVPPRPFSPAGELPNAWDDLAKATTGERWRLVASVKAPVGARWAPVVAPFRSPYDTALVSNYGGRWVSGGAPQTGTGGWQAVDAVFEFTTLDPPAWLGLGIQMLSNPFLGRTWAEQTGTWAADTRHWDDPALEVRFTLDNLAVHPPGQGTTRRVLAFSGAVSDVKAVPDAGGGLLYTITAADLGADLGNTVVGDTPWPVQTIAVRANRITQLAGITTTPRIRIDAPLDALQVSYRDVDAQPAYALLQDLATSGGGVLWAATHAVTGAFLWMENPDRRVSVAELTLSGGQIVITGQAENVTTISACDLLEEGVAWLQDTQDVATVVAVTWQEQTLDDKGQPAPTDRTVTVTAAAADVDKYGTRRLSITTELVSAADATTYANRALAQARAVGWRVEGLTADTATMPEVVPSLDDATRQVGLLNMLDGTTRMGLALTLVDMPGYAPRGAVSSYYLEGGRYGYTGGAWALELVAAPAAGQGQSATWAQLDPTWRWNQWAPTVQWQDLFGVAA